MQDHDVAGLDGREDLGPAVAVQIREIREHYFAAKGSEGVFRPRLVDAVGGGAWVLQPEESRPGALAVGEKQVRVAVTVEVVRV